MPRCAVLRYGGIVALCIVLGAHSPASSEESSSGDDLRCSVIRSEVKSKRGQLAGHIDALRKLNDQSELLAMGVVNHKIYEIIEELKTLEEISRTCAGQIPPETASGLSAVKSDPARYANKSCDELRKILILVLKQVSGLKRREISLFSSLTAAELQELQEAEKTIKELQTAMQRKCPAGPVAPRTPTRLR
jgi:hypothetical protein